MVPAGSLTIVSGSADEGRGTSVTKGPAVAKPVLVTVRVPVMYRPSWMALGLSDTEVTRAGRLADH